MGPIAASISGAVASWEPWRVREAAQFSCQTRALGGGKQPPPRAHVTLQRLGSRHHTVQLDQNARIVGSDEPLPAFAAATPTKRNQVFIAGPAPLPSARAHMLALLAPFPAALPDAPHSSAEWKIAAYSSAAPAEIAAGATIYDNDGKTVLRAGTNAWSCMPANPKGPDADGAYSSAHKAMPFCFDAEGYKWVVGFMTDTAPVMERDTYMWMLHGDNGEDNTKRLVLSVDDVEDPQTGSRPART